jgi:hypothetical protein
MVTIGWCTSTGIGEPRTSTGGAAGLDLGLAPAAPGYRAQRQNQAQYTLANDESICTRRSMDFGLSIDGSAAKSSLRGYGFGYRLAPDVTKTGDFHGEEHADASQQPSGDLLGYWWELKSAILLCPS